MDFQSNNHDLLFFVAASSFAARIGAANIGFIYFNATTETGPVRDEPWLVSAGVTLSKLSDNSRSQELASDQAHSPHPSGWSQTTWRQPRFSMAFASDRKWFLPLPTPRFRTADNGDNLDLLSP
jgi:hypothetical protein